MSAQKRRSVRPHRHCAPEKAVPAHQRKDSKERLSAQVSAGETVCTNKHRERLGPNGRSRLFLRCSPARRPLFLPQSPGCMCVRHLASCAAQWHPRVLTQSMWSHLVDIDLRDVLQFVSFPPLYLQKEQQKTADVRGCHLARSNRQSRR